MAVKPHRNSSISNRAEKISSRVEKIFSQVFGREIALGPELGPANFAPWDSLTHVQLILAVERGFGIRFSMLEVTSIRNVGQLIKLIENKIG